MMMVILHVHVCARNGSSALFAARLRCCAKLCGLVLGLPGDGRGAGLAMILVGVSLLLVVTGIGAERGSSASASSLAGASFPRPDVAHGD